MCVLFIYIVTQNEEIYYEQYYLLFLQISTILRFKHRKTHKIMEFFNFFLLLFISFFDKIAIEIVKP